MPSVDVAVISVSNDDSSVENEEEAEAEVEQSMDEMMQLLGVSVDYLETVFLKEVEAAGWDRNVTIAQLEGLQVFQEEEGGQQVDEEVKEEEGEEADAEEETVKPKHVKGPRPPPIILNKGQDVICPIDGKVGAAYVHCLLENIVEDRPIGSATIYLLYANQYTLGEILEGLADYCVTNNVVNKECYVWMYCLCANLHRIPQITNEDFYMQPCVPLEVMESHFERMKHRILNIRHVMALLSPWKDPILLKRSWCTMELYATRQVMKEQSEQGLEADEEVQVSIIFPPSQKMDLEINLLSGPKDLRGLDMRGGVVDTFYKTLGNIKVQLATATLHQDRNGILNFVEEQTGGRPQYNFHCNCVTRQWFRRLKEEIDHLPQHTIPQKYPLKPVSVLTVDLLVQQYAIYFEQLVILFESNEEKEAAVEMRNRQLKIQSYLKEDPAQQQLQFVPKRPLTYYNAATRLAEAEDWDGAMLALGKTMAIYESAYGKQHIATGTVYSRIGDMLMAKAKTDPSHKRGAMIAYKRALDVQEVKLGKLHPVTGANYIRLGLYLEEVNKFDTALEFYTNGQQLIGSWNPLAVRPFVTLEKKFLLKGQDKEAQLVRLKGETLQECLDMPEEPVPEPEPEPPMQEESAEKTGEEAESGEPTSEKDAPTQMDDVDEAENDEGAKPEMEDLLSEYQETLEKANSSKPQVAKADEIDC